MSTSSSAAVSKVSRQPERTRLYRLGFWISGNPLKVLGAWLVLFICAAVTASYFTANLKGTDNTVIGSDSHRARQLIEEKFPDTPSETDFVVLHSAATTTDEEVFRRVVRAALDRYRASSAVAQATSPYAAPQRLIAPDRHTALLPVGLNGTDKQMKDAAEGLQDLASELSTGEIAVYFTGRAPLAAASADQSSADLSRAESIGFPAAALLLLIAFGSVVAAAIPLALGFLAVLAAFGVLGVVSVFTSFDVFVQTAVSMVGIALGIDYSLFIVTRFREELARATGSTREDRARAVGRTLATAGNAVLFSGITVVVSLLGLWLVRSPKVHSMAMGMTAAVLAMLSISVLLLPAILGLLGARVNRLALPWAKRSLAHPDPEHSTWARLVGAVMRRPVLVATAAVVLLGFLAVPVFGLRSGVDLGATTLSDSAAGKG
ncbi:MAG: MMPL family transporter, partial [Dactylosporangium sp.]|nr:MMPL family transporter [Dactylosporangium sp.]NNJ61944.1 MMPL family transporter [Dactylosporangium sp.]